MFIAMVATGQKRDSLYSDWVREPFEIKIKALHAQGHPYCGPRDSAVAYLHITLAQSEEFPEVLVAQNARGTYAVYFSYWGMWEEVLLTPHLPSIEGYDPNGGVLIAIGPDMQIFHRTTTSYKHSFAWRREK